MAAKLKKRALAEYQTQTQPAQSEDRMGFVNYSLLALLLSTLFSRSDGSLFFNNPLRAATASRKIIISAMSMLVTLFCPHVGLNQDEIYTGLMSTENQVIVIVQNFYAWVTSSIGFLLLIPFYQVTQQIQNIFKYFTEGSQLS